MKLTIITTLTTAIFLAGCVPLPEPAAIVPQATGGNLAQGSVEMSYTKPPHLRPRVDWQAAQQSAVNRCNGWGFSGAQAYANDRQECVSQDVNGNCRLQQITRVYQCTQ